MKLTIKTTLLVAALCWAGIAGAQKADNRTLVTIGDVPVSVDSFVKVYEKNNSIGDTSYRDTMREYLDLYVNFRLKVMEAEALELDTSAAFKKELAGYRTQLAKPYFIDEQVNEALLQEAYDRLTKDVRASHILIMVDENARPEDTLKAYNKIMDIRKEITSGKKTFAEAAVEYSDDQSARDREATPGQQNFRKGNAGDLGYFTVFNMVYPFENAAYETAVGSISMPVRSKYGYHLVEVNDLRPAMGVAEVAHIYVAVRPDATDDDVARKTEKINNIALKLSEGMSFEDAVVEYSEDKGSVQNEGKLSKFTSSRVVPQFVLTVDSLEKGQVSGPVRTQYGWHIIKLIGRETPGTFDEEAPELRERLTKDQRTHKSEEAVITAIKKDNKFKEYKKNVTAITSCVDSSVMAAAFSAAPYAGWDKPVMKLGKQVWTQADFAQYVESHQKKSEGIDKDVLVRRMYGEFVKDNCLEYMDGQLEAMYPDFADLINEYHDGILLFNLTDEMVWSKAVEDTAGLKKYFSEHRNDYMWDQRVDATVYTIRKKDDVAAVEALLNANEGDGELAKALDADSIRSVRMTPGKFEKGDNAEIDKVSWLPGLYGPMASDVEDKTVFVRVRALLPPKVKELDEARGLVTADYQNYLEKQWLQQLREKYPVVVNEVVLDEVTANP